MLNKKTLDDLFEVIRLQSDMISSLMDISDNFQNRISEAEQRIAFLEATMYEQDREFQFGKSSTDTLQ